MKYIIFFILPLIFVSVNAWSDTLEQAVTLYKQGDKEQAKQLFLSLPQQAVALTYLARMASDNDLDEAESLIEKATKLAPKNPETAYTKGVIMGMQASTSIFSALGYAKKSLAAFELAVTIAPDNVNYRQGLMKFYLAAPGIAGGDEAKAYQQVQAIQQLSEYQGLHAELEYYQATENEKAVTETANKAIKAYPNIADFYARHGMFLQQNEQFDQAIALFLTAFQKTEQMDESEFYRYLSLYQIGRTAVLGENWFEQGQQALVDYVKSAPILEQLPDKDWASFRLAQILLFQHKSSEAKALLNSLVKSNDDKLKKQSKKLLRQIS
ncbi:hypothetical protein [Aliiglaciecola sp. LCG003]|uniref:tetratricopeptide repeat protein n=1 Tax=Aliiglaciecola sp. LCG003 TaxID=3053655 RepID=UPI00257286B7|nr:hypothetical protein [Aliiglaciecola sp. LCG003]WJG10314.1 hypothetical protein QR722_04565 [Aliiglaciecola sp. LCG003]